MLRNLFTELICTADGVKKVQRLAEERREEQSGGEADELQRDPPCGA